MIAAAERPVIYAGGGIGIGRAIQAFRDFVAETGIPVVSTLKGLGAVPTDEPLLPRHAGHARNARGQHRRAAVGPADRRRRALRRPRHRQARRIRAGRAASSTSTSTRPRSASSARADVALAGDLAALARRAALGQRPRIGAWRRHCLRMKAEHAWRYDAPGDGIYAPELLRRLSARRATAKRPSPATSASTRCGSRSTA